MKLEFAEGSLIGPQVGAPVALVTVPVAPPLAFDLPRSMMRQLVLAGIAYIAVMAFALRQGAGIGLVFAVLGLALATYHGLPLLLARAVTAKPRRERQAGRGIGTAGSHRPGRAAWAQIVTVPLLMLGWALVVAILN